MALTTDQLAHMEGAISDLGWKLLQAKAKVAITNATVWGAIDPLGAKAAVEQRLYVAGKWLELLKTTGRADVLAGKRTLDSWLADADRYVYQAIAGALELDSKWGFLGFAGAVAKQAAANLPKQLELGNELLTVIVIGLVAIAVIQLAGVFRRA